VDAQQPSAAEAWAQEPADLFHQARATGGLLAELYAEAFGDEYPDLVDASSSCTWSVLADMIAGLRLRPGGLLVDLGCGRGGTGLWLARACSARLVGIDLSPVAVALAAARVPGFLPERGGDARFEVATFEETGLPDACADGVVSMDALPFSPDRAAALRELRRILKPGTRAVFTAVDKRPGHARFDPGEPTWRERIGAAGLELEAERERPEESGLWRRLYELCEANEAGLRAQIGDAATDQLLREAAANDPIMDAAFRRALVFTVRAAASP
jgi:ubiquinone/menaquinone biosynthesis C-methylase UbiE